MSINKIKYKTLWFAALFIPAVSSISIICANDSKLLAGNDSPKDTSEIIPYKDGPYIRWKRNKVSVVYYFVDEQNGRTKVRRKRYNTKADSITIKGFSFDTNVYKLHKNPMVSKAIWNNVEKIFAIGDVHGEFHEMIKLLQNNEIINKKLEWSWGKGHLVFAGDIFDRGNHVTECLWFIYHLEKQAEKAGGKVHFILGTHEILTMNYFNGYLSEKYNHLFTRRDRRYSDYYRKQYVLGKWLRTKNTIVVLNNILFVHAGISEELLNLRLDINTLNEKVRQYLYNAYRFRKDMNMQIIIGKKGPFWYRGYNADYDGNVEITQELVDEILHYYKVSHIVFAHTEMEDIVPTFEGKLINIDIPLDILDTEHQGLYIDQSGFYKMFQNKSEKIKLKVN